MADERALFDLVRGLVEIESITFAEAPAIDFMEHVLVDLAKRHAGTVERIPVEPERDNLLATFGDTPRITLTTHLDTVPPFVPFREDADNLWGRGSCDAKGIAACMVKAVEAALADGATDLGLMFVVGEERNSAGAKRMAGVDRGCRYLINGEPTSNRLALGSKGVLRHEISAAGKMAHSAYPELGDSATAKLIRALDRLLDAPLPSHDILGPSTLNIGTIQGGRAPNVIADHAMAEVLTRLVDDAEPVRDIICRAVEPEAEAVEVLHIPAVHLGSLPGYETCIVAYTTDIPAFGPNWGTPFLVGPGTIHVAHTEYEHIAKHELIEAVEVYRQLIHDLGERR
ncbi:MAG: M20/M25/M40 family metallo-hydrolase [Fimbriimonadaceae bacterium]